MYEIDEAELPKIVDVVDVDVRAWVEAARNDPILYRDRQVTEIVLTAIGVAPELNKILVLKGGTLMALAFKSERVTGDVDFTAQADPHEFDKEFTKVMSELLPRTAIRLGYLDLVCAVQTVKKLPRSLNFEGHDFPALAIKIGSARRNTPEEKRLAAGQAIRVLDIEISFRDQVFQFQSLNLMEAGVAVRAFSVHEIIAEKIRALLQQPIRKRFRRQDVFDVAYLIESNAIDVDDLYSIHRILIEKCRSRKIYPTIRTIDDPEIERMAKADWDTLKLEIHDLPEFDARFALVRDFYRSLPWD